MSEKSPLTYRGAGVDIDEGARLVDLIGPAAKSTSRPGADAALGGFAAAFDLKAAGYVDPILLATTDGVGTKLRVAIDSGRHETVGVDLVAMCVNDLVAQGGEPLLFLDYYATGKLDADVAAVVVKGIAEGCRQAGCALAGGETAEMPGHYRDGDYDLAGFAMGAAERGTLLPRADIAPGDALLGLASSGPHSNGFSLIRRIVERSGLAWSDRAPFAETSLAEALLAPTRIYVRALLPLVKEGVVKGLAHITGGGLIENPPRALPKGFSGRLDIDFAAWPVPPVFDWLIREGGLEPEEARRTFNLGVGMIAIVAPSDAAAVQARLAAAGETVFQIGAVRA